MPVVKDLSIEKKLEEGVRLGNQPIIRGALYEQRHSLGIRDVFIQRAEPVRRSLYEGIPSLDEIKTEYMSNYQARVDYLLNIAFRKDHPKYALFRTKMDSLILGYLSNDSIIMPPSINEDESNILKCLAANFAKQVCAAIGRDDLAERIRYDGKRV